MQLAFAAVQHGGNNLIHVVILVLTQTSAEDDLRLGVGQLLVLGIQCAVFSIVDGVVRFIAGLPLRGILAADDRLGQVVAVLVLAELEPFMLNDAGPRVSRYSGSCRCLPFSCTGLSPSLACLPRQFH